MAPRRRPSSRAWPAQRRRRRTRRDLSQYCETFSPRAPAPAAPPLPAQHAIRRDRSDEGAPSRRRSKLLPRRARGDRLATEQTGGEPIGDEAIANPSVNPLALVTHDGVWQCWRWLKLGHTQERQPAPPRNQFRSSATDAPARPQSPYHRPAHIAAAEVSPVAHQRIRVGAQRSRPQPPPLADLVGEHWAKLPATTPSDSRCHWLVRTGGRYLACAPTHKSDSVGKTYVVLGEGSLGRLGTQ